MDQHGLTRADLVPLFGTASRVSEVLNGKRSLSLVMVRRLSRRFHIPADLLIAASPRKGRDQRSRRAARRKAGKRKDGREARKPKSRRATRARPRPAPAAE